MKLNLKQKKILKLLSINCRFTNKDIAKSIGISEDAVAYQIENLIEKQKLARFNIQFFHPAIDYDSHHVWLRLKTNQGIEKLKAIKEIHAINKSHGRFDLQILIFAKSKRQLQNTLKKVRKVIQIKKMKHSKLVGVYKSFSNVIPPIDTKAKVPKNPKKFEYVLNTKKYPVYEFDKRIKIDETDKILIKELMKNPRASFQELSQKIKLNHETIRYHLKNLVKKGFITNFGLIHDFLKYGLYTNYFLISLNEKNLDKKTFREYLNSTKNIFYCAKLDGDYNCIVYVSSKNPSELGRIQENLMKTLGNSIKEIDLLFMGEMLKYEQFPRAVLE